MSASADPLAGGVAVVTGAASGIGRATAIALVGAGAHTVLVDRDASGLAELAQKLGAERVTSRPFDLAATSELPSLVKEIVDATGRIDILVNVAAIVSRTPLLEFDDADWEQIMAIDLKAPSVLVREVGKHMAERGGGRIVNVSSSSAFRAQAAPALYSIAKAGLNQLTRIAAAELGPHGVNVNAVAPGLTLTPMTSGSYPTEESATKAMTSGPIANLLHRASEPEDVAEVILFLCLPGSRQMTGQVVHTSAGQVV